MLLAGGDVESSSNYLYAVGNARIGGSTSNPAYFSATNLNEYDATVIDILSWKLYYNQFDKSIANPDMPASVDPDTADKMYEYYPFLGPGEYPGNRVEGQKIYFYRRRIDKKPESEKTVTYMYPRQPQYIKFHI